MGVPVVFQRSRLGPAATQLPGRQVAHAVWRLQLRVEFAAVEIALLQTICNTSQLNIRAKVGPHIAVPDEELRAEIRECLFRDRTVDSEDLVASSGLAS